MQAVKPVEVLISQRNNLSQRLERRREEVLPTTWDDPLFLEVDGGSWAVRVHSAHQASRGLSTLADEWVEPRQLELKIALVRESDLPRSLWGLFSERKVGIIGPRYRGPGE